ncbi:MAG: guanylate kinase [Nitrospinae bacterium]|nr:guanylate kinase [Nitrospinota bacterium]
MMQSRGRLFVISAPSGAGKSTLIDRSCRELPNIWHSISATTRPRREYEEDGVHYFFMERPRFDEMIARNEFLEWAHVFEECYGTPAEAVDARLAGGDDVIMDLDVQGALQVKRRRAEASLVFVMPPSLDELSTRLEQRATETGEDAELRLSRAEEEMAQSHQFDHVIINDDLDVAFQELKKIILNHRGEVDSP